MVDCQKDHRLNQLRLNNRAADANDRFAGKNRRAFRNRPYVALKLEIPQVVDKFRREESPPVQICQVGLSKMQIREVFDDLFETRQDRKTTDRKSPTLSDLSRFFPANRSFASAARLFRHN